MNYEQSNVGPGMVPCRNNCQCSECTIDRLLSDNKILRKLVIDAEEILSHMTELDGMDIQVWRQQASVYFDD